MLRAEEISIILAQFCQRTVSFLNNTFTIVKLVVYLFPIIIERRDDETWPKYIYEDILAQFCTIFTQFCIYLNSHIIHVQGNQVQPLGETMHDQISLTKQSLGNSTRIKKIMSFEQFDEKRHKMQFLGLKRKMKPVILTPQIIIFESLGSVKSFMGLNFC